MLIVFCGMLIEKWLMWKKEPRACCEVFFWHKKCERNVIKKKYYGELKLTCDLHINEWFIYLKLTPEVIISCWLLSVH